LSFTRHILPATADYQQTPSLVHPVLLESILSALQQQFGIAADAEVSIEADPGTFDLQRLLQYKALGITRVSMGVQSFQEVGLLGVISSWCRSMG
jgi:coproporphyrinogen III oxidase-like Fe-S oxidoreductase